jgi:hypothetical protein
MWIIMNGSDEFNKRVGFIMPDASYGSFVCVFYGNWEECARLCNFLNGGDGVFPVHGFYKGVPTTGL